MQDSIILKQHHEDYVELIQFTDTHIFASQDHTFDGIDTMASLEQVIAHARAQCWPTDAILVTGDLVHDPVPTAYERLSVVLGKIQSPVFCLPGNHDAPELMYQILCNENIKILNSIITNYWLILMLDTFLLNTHAGHLDVEELDMLDQRLNQYKNKHVLICLHHPPVPIDSPWMDKMGLDNPAEFFAVIDKYSHVRGILWGHVHQEFMMTRKNVLLMSSPSTCVQFTPGTERYIKDDKQAGYRRLKLLASGEIITDVFRI
ncbi:MAG: phosphodiesterase [Gammaproteobacteria bacterium]|nr:phosphodiesterase [Gammaproteobacteria bacterium]